MITLRTTLSGSSQQPSAFRTPHRTQVGDPLGSRAPVTMLSQSSRGLKTCQLLESPAKLININYAKRDESTVFSVGRFFCNDYQAGGTNCVTPLSWQILIVGRSANYDSWQISLPPIIVLGIEYNILLGIVFDIVLNIILSRARPGFTMEIVERPTKNLHFTPSTYTRPGLIRPGRVSS